MFLDGFSDPMALWASIQDQKEGAEVYCKSSVQLQNSHLKLSISNPVVHFMAALKTGTPISSKGTNWYFFYVLLIINATRKKYECNNYIYQIYQRLSIYQRLYIKDCLFFISDCKQPTKSCEYLSSVTWPTLATESH